MERSRGIGVVVEVEAVESSENRLRTLRRRRTVEIHQGPTIDIFSQQRKLIAKVPEPGVR